MPLSTPNRLSLGGSEAACRSIAILYPLRVTYKLARNLSAGISSSMSLVRPCGRAVAGPSLSTASSSIAWAYTSEADLIFPTCAIALNELIASKVAAVHPTLRPSVN
jgi:hypothetical protein